MKASELKEQIIEQGIMLDCMQTINDNLKAKIKELEDKLKKLVP